MKIKEFFAPTYNKLAWFFLILFLAQLYSYVIMPYIQISVIQEFINFILNPANIIVMTSSGVESNIALPISITINAMWNYALSCLILKELSHAFVQSLCLNQLMPEFNHIPLSRDTCQAFFL